MRAFFRLVYGVVVCGSLDGLARPLDGVPERGATAADFAPRGWKVESTLAADLDGAAPEDLVVALLGPGDVDQQRALVWLHGQKAGGFTRVDTNMGLLACLDCLGVKGGSGAPDLSVSKRVLTVTSMGGSRESYSATHRFRLKRGLVRLIGVDHWDGDSLSGEARTRSENLLTGVTVVETQAATEDETGRPSGRKATKKTTRATPGPPVRLQDVTEFGSDGDR